MSTATRQISVEAYLGMIQDGTIGDDDKVELLDGEIVDKMGRTPPHLLATRLTYKTLTRVLPPGWSLTKEDAVRLFLSVPEPDIAVIRGDDSDYADRLPGTAEVGLIVEVSESSLKRDRNLKLPIYARSNLPIYWIINLVDHCLEVYSDPRDSHYQTHRVLGPDETVSLILDGLEVARISVRDLLP